MKKEGNRVDGIGGGSPYTLKGDLLKRSMGKMKDKRRNVISERMGHSGEPSEQT